MNIVNKFGEMTGLERKKVTDNPVKDLKRLFILR
jgi:hypothetical protein|tara:strand:- start:1140 stop:1241 length:102 start_codon:yes stop_codon:yes gene_type:complete